MGKIFKKYTERGDIFGKEVHEEMFKIISYWETT